MNEKNKDFKMQEEKSNTLMDIKRTIRKLHENNRNDVPQYLDTIKTKKKMQIREATYDNDFLKYML